MVRRARPYLQPNKDAGDAGPEGKRSARQAATEPGAEAGGERRFFAESIRYLGVLINRRLIWSHHIKERYRKCVAIFHKTLIAKDWGLAPKRILWVYQAIILPKLTYTALVWGHEVNKTAGKWLKRLQRMALSQLLRPWRTTAANLIEVISDMMPVDILLQELASKARLRTAGASKDCWNGISDRGNKVGHRKIWDNLLNECGATTHPSDTMKRERIWTPRQEVQKPRLLVYTDGSRMSERTGYVVAVTKGNHVLKEEDSFLGQRFLP